MIHDTIRWRLRMQRLLRLILIAAVAYTVYDWVNAVLYQAMNGYYGAALNLSYKSREFIHLATILGFGAAFLWFERRLIRWLAPIPPRTCHECGYSLEGRATTRCPECGATIPEKNPQSTTTASRQHE